MKKLFGLLFALLLAGSALAQQKIYVSLGPGIGFGTASSYDFYQDGEKVYPVALGKAVGANLHAGFFLNDFIAIDLGVSYKIGLNTKIEPPVASGDIKSSGSTLTLKYKGSMLQLIPGVVVSPDLGGNLRPYARVGLIIAVMNSITTGIDSKSTWGNVTATMKYSGGVALGGSLALGADFALNDLLSIYAEIFYDALSYAPKKGEFKKYELNGVDQLGDMTVNDKKVEFVKDITDFVASDDNPDQQLKNSYPFNSLGLNIGVKIKL